MSWSEQELRTHVEKLRGEFDTVISLSAGDETESLVRFITNELDDESLDHMEVMRDLERRRDLASEPVTVAALLGLGGVTAVAVGRIIERWQENRRQREAAKTIIEAFKVSKDAGIALTELESRHADVAVAYQLAEPGTALPL